MKGRINGLVAAAALIVAAACSDATPTSALVESGDGFVQARNQGQLTFSSTQSYDTETPQTSSGGTGTISFTGSMFTGTPCYNVTATHSATTNAVKVTVTASPTGQACIQVITYNNYTGAVSGLAAGTYTFTVVHSSGGRTETVHTNTVVVN